MHTYLGNSLIVLTVDGLRSVNLSFVDCQTLAVFGGARV